MPWYCGPSVTLLSWRHRVTAGRHWSWCHLRRGWFPESTHLILRSTEPMCTFCYWRDFQIVFIAKNIDPLCLFCKSHLACTVIMSHSWVWVVLLCPHRSLYQRSLSCSWCSTRSDSTPRPSAMRKRLNNLEKASWTDHLCFTSVLWAHQTKTLQPSACIATGKQFMYCFRN